MSFWDWIVQDDISFKQQAIRRITFLVLGVVTLTILSWCGNQVFGARDCAPYCVTTTP